MSHIIPLARLNEQYGREDRHLQFQNQIQLSGSLRSRPDDISVHQVSQMSSATYVVTYRGSETAASPNTLNLQDARSGEEDLDSVRL
jgi:hypothetical protein